MDRLAILSTPPSFPPSFAHRNPQRIGAANTGRSASMSNHTQHAPRISVVGAGISAAIALAALAGSAAAQSVGSDAPISVKVGYGDLNLASEAGASTMLVRIQSAASRACGEAPDLRDLGRVAIYDHCRAEAISRAVRMLGSPLVTSLAREPASPVALSSK
jgi:UrcA family protein